MDEAEKAFKSWYYEHGASWNPAHIKPVWMAAWATARETFNSLEKKHD